jgi:hypothetical protein
MENPVQNLNGNTVRLHVLEFYEKVLTVFTMYACECLCLYVYVLQRL